MKITFKRAHKKWKPIRGQSNSHLTNKIDEKKLNTKIDFCIKMTKKSSFVLHMEIDLIL